jgi:hypothetical protein
MAATAGLSLTLDTMGKMFQNASSLKPLGQLKPKANHVYFNNIFIEFFQRHCVKYDYQIWKTLGNGTFKISRRIMLTEFHLYATNNVSKF